MKIPPLASAVSRVAGQLAAEHKLARRAYHLGARAYTLATGDREQEIRRRINIERALPSVWNGEASYSPAYPLSGMPRGRVDMERLVAHYDCFFVDIFGTYKTENGIWPEAVKALRLIRESGKVFIIISNTTDISPEVTLQQLNEAGVQIGLDQLVTSGQLLRRFLRDFGLAGKRILSLGTESTDDYLRAAGTEPVKEIDAAYEAILIAFLKNGLPEEDQAKLAARAATGLPIILANADKFLPLDSGLIENKAYVLARTISRRANNRVVILGKPDIRIYDEAHRRLATSRPLRLLCIGDTLWTDILGAKGFQAAHPASQVDSLLVLSGTERRVHHYPELLLRYMELKDAFPTYVLPKLAV